MLRSIRLNTFKCFHDVTIPLRGLMLFAGVNGAGKSTVLQSLLLLHQALGDDANGSRDVVPLNGPLLSLGSVRDVVNEVAGGRSFGIELVTDDLRVSWEFAGADSLRDDLAPRVNATVVSHRGDVLVPTTQGLFPATFATSPDGSVLLRALQSLRFVPADRLGPSEAYPLYEAQRHKTLGPRAERAVGVLRVKRDDDLPLSALRHPDPSYPAIFVRQVDAWLEEIFPGVQIDVRPVERANLATLGVRTSEATDFARPQHVGFGITYALSIVIALLSADAGDIVILENPEAHLHPRAQSRITELCACAAAAGVQVLIETHSDHVLNAIRVAVHRSRLGPEDVGIVFFERASGTEAPNLRQIRLDSRGRFSERPRGFFDETERQLSALLATDRHGDA